MAKRKKRDSLERNEWPHDSTQWYKDREWREIIKAFEMWDSILWFGLTDMEPFKISEFVQRTTNLAALLHSKQIDPSPIWRTCQAVESRRKYVPPEPEAPATTGICPITNEEVEIGPFYAPELPRVPRKSPAEITELYTVARYVLNMAIKLGTQDSPPPEARGLVREKASQLMADRLREDYLTAIEWTVEKWQKYLEKEVPGISTSTISKTDIWEHIMEVRKGGFDATLDHSEDKREPGERRLGRTPGSESQQAWEGVGSYSDDDLGD